jgi:hypothetical protein
MGASAKLEGLKQSWIVYSVFAAVVEIARDGLDSYSLTNAAIRIGVTFGFAWYLTKQLREKSSLVWAFGVVFGLLGTIVACITIVETLVDVSEGNGFELSRFLLAAASAVIHVRTFRVLRDALVKRHVMAD